MSKEDIISNLREREFKFSLQQPVKYLSDLLEDEMSGIKRLPSLMFSEPDKALEELNLSKYEILNNEPLHYMYNHIKNLYFQSIIPFLKRETTWDHNQYIIQR